MNQILVIGAGRSATSAIDYLLKEAAQHEWMITVADADPDLAAKKVSGHPNGRSAWLDVHKVKERKDLIGRHDLIISLLPAFLHTLVAHDCIELNKHLITASYVSNEMKELNDKARAKELIFMSEIGLDPGIDHMSAMEHIHRIQAQGGQLTSFKSYTGGLIARDSDTNPWHYKFTWNPRNVVLAGQGTAQYLKEGKINFIPYRRLFQSAEEVDIPDFGKLEMYANRDSLLYREHYELDNIPNLLRGTLRYPGYCAAWDALIRIGLTDDAHPIVGSEKLTWHQLMDGYAPDGSGSVQDRVADLLGENPLGEVMNKLEWLGLFSNRSIGVKNASPALMLESLLKEKWKLEPNDKDLIVMHHEFQYELEGQNHLATSTLQLEGEDQVHTAMAKLVGLPLAIFAKLVMLNKVTSHGVQIPTQPEVYQPVLRELENFGVRFKNYDHVITSK